MLTKRDLPTDEKIRMGPIEAFDVDDADDDACAVAMLISFVADHAGCRAAGRRAAFERPRPFQGLGRLDDDDVGIAGEVLDLFKPEPHRGEPALGAIMRSEPHRLGRPDENIHLDVLTPVGGVQILDRGLAFGNLPGSNRGAEPRGLCGEGGSHLEATLHLGFGGVDPRVAVGQDPKLRMHAPSRKGFIPVRHGCDPLRMATMARNQRGFYACTLPAWWTRSCWRGTNIWPPKIAS